MNCSGQYVNLAGLGKFHHPHLARALHSAGLLNAYCSGYPKRKLDLPQLGREQFRLYPYFQAPVMLARRLGFFPENGLARREIEWLLIDSFSKFVERNCSDSKILVALSTSGLLGGRVVKRRGGVFVCDRGSSHIKYQNQILKEEHASWKIPFEEIDTRIIERELSEYDEADFITVPSKFNVRSFTSNGVPESKLRQIAYGGNLSRFFRTDNPKPPKFIVLFVGNVSIRKGIGYLLEAFQNFKHPSKELWIVGPVPESTKKILSRFNLSQVKFLGRANQSELNAYYNAASVFVLPSIEEGLAMVQGEALACGCPVIASENSGGEELIENGIEGFIVPIRNSQAIVDKLELLADSPELLQSMSFKAMERIKRCGGWSEYGDNYVTFIKSLLSRMTP